MKLSIRVVASILATVLISGCPNNPQTEFSEIEPNNSLAAAQSLPIPATVTGSQINNDEYSTVPVTYCYGSSCISTNVSCHDFYTFTVSTFGRYTIALDFDDAAYDMGLYLIQPSGGGYELLHYAETHISGMDGDLDVGDTLQYGTYYVCVASFDLATDVPYQLRLFLAVSYE